MAVNPLTSNKARTWLIGIAGVLLVYALLGFFGLPWLLEREMKSMASERLELSLELDRLSFNPFTMVLELEGLTLDESDASSLLQVEHFRSNFQPTRLLFLRLQLAELAVTELDMYLTRYSESENTISNLGERWERSAAETDEPESESGSIPFVIELINLSNLNFHIRDEVPEAPFETTLTLADARIEGLTSIDNEQASKRLVFNLDNGATAEWAGQMQVDPLRLSGELDLSDFTLDPVNHYLEESLPLAITEGRVALSFGYELNLGDEEINAEISRILASVQGLQLNRTGAAEPFLVMEELRIENGSLRYPENHVDLSNVSVNVLQLNLRRDSEGRFNLQQLLSSLPESGDTTAADAPDNGGGSESSNTWRLALEELVLNDNRLSLTDASLDAPATLGADLQLSLRNISNEPARSMPYTLAMTLDSGGELDLNGQLTLLPELLLDAGGTIDAVDLTVLQPYIAEYSYLELRNGLLDAQPNISYSAGEALRAEADILLREFSSADLQRDETVLEWQSIAVNGMNYQQANDQQPKDSLEISEIILDRLFARVIVNEDGSTNVGRTMRPAGEDEEQAAGEVSPGGETDELPLTLSLGRIEVQEGSSRFTDHNLPIVFEANITGLNGNSDGFSTQSSEPLELEMEGEVGEYGLLQFSSALFPFEFMTQSQIDMQFSNLDMPSFTPYTIKFAGREIAEGSMDVDMQYQIDDGQLQATNNLVLRNLQLGEQVDHPSAMDLPLDMAMALLRDSNGVIDLDIPVSGDVTDPNFDLGPVIRSAIGNVLTNIVTAPFRLLGNLIGSGDSSMDTIRFRPGRADLAPPEQQALQQLVQALNQRPQLVLQIPLVVADADREALKSQTVSARIEGRLQQGSETQAPLLERRRAVLENLYREAGLSPAPEELQSANQLENEVSNPLTGEPMPGSELDVPAYLEDMRSRLIEAESIAESELDVLARERVEAISTYLREQGEISPDRLETGEERSSELNDDGWLSLELGLRST